MRPPPAGDAGTTGKEPGTLPVGKVPGPHFVRLPVGHGLEQETGMFVPSAVPVPRNPNVVLPLGDN
jgi:hypothetical protein